jgi:hypothetical protein
VAGGKHSVESTPDPEQEKRWQLAYRTDLANAFGLVLSMPAHGRNNLGNWQYGLIPMGETSQTLEDDFRTEMHSIIHSHTSFLISQGLLTHEQVEDIEGHSYSVGPAAQEWPRFFFELYRDAQPFLTDGASLLGWGYFLKDVIREINYWASRKQQEVDESRDAETVRVEQWAEVEVTHVLTRADLIALCYADMMKRYGIGQVVTIDTFPRSFTEFATPDHPSGPETYLIRIKAGKRRFFYLVNSKGEVSEHFLTTGDDLTLLPLPNLLDDDLPLTVRQPQLSKRIKVMAK